ncbi:glutaminyl-tRNA synthase (glutamine-hydrolyzing) subunit A [PVC group bacterium (ex Bugula neritina AB1)]|nr:glutaminyl-tRNA synthase (glutamine-hydrolyzing) subunit A [PVC group bacterium (ex Bugula neritina AB1)]
MKDLTLLSANQIVKQIKEKSLKAFDVCKAYLDRIEKLNPSINAYTHINKESALNKASEIDQKIANGEPVGSMAGVPVALKDNISHKNQPLSSASDILGANDRPYHSPYNAFVVERLLDEDAVILGRTNMDEFAMGSSTETSAYGVTRNPWDLERVPGGSSGGSAAAVAARLACIALGSDTGGSIRQPASFCGVLGLKPTYGEVSRFGLAAFASSLDQIGPFARKTEDIALVMEVIAKHDPQDSTSIPSDDFYGSYLDHIQGDVENLKIAIPSFSWSDAVDKDIQNSLLQTKKSLQKRGARFEDIDLPYNKYAVSVYYILATAEASSNLARYDGVQYGFRDNNQTDLEEMYQGTRSKGFGKEVQRRILLGTYVLSSGYYDAYYKKAQKVQSLIKETYHSVFFKDNFDAIMLPTSPTAAFRFGEKSQDPLQMYLSDIFTIGSNLAGLPAISVPSGLNENNLPLGVQIIGPPGKGLQSLLAISSAHESDTPVPKLEM